MILANLHTNYQNILTVLLHCCCSVSIKNKLITALHTKTVFDDLKKKKKKGRP